jgi:hypothetical protein
MRRRYHVGEWPERPMELVVDLEEEVPEESGK